MPRRAYPNLFAYLQACGETQTAVAHKLGISVGMLSLIKWGQRQPTLALAMKIADYCNIPLESLRMPGRKAS
jgi:DNA-binding XRE family transcriptional regulator